MNSDFGYKIQQGFKLIDELSKGAKSVDQIASILNCSQRTALRWVFMLDDIGFSVRRIPYRGRKVRYQIDTNRVPKFVERFIKPKNHV